MQRVADPNDASTVAKIATLQPRHRVISQAGPVPGGAHHRSRTSRHLSPIPTASPLQKFFLPSLFFWETPLPFLWTPTLLPHMRLENRHPDVLAGSTLHRRLVRTANGRGISDGAYPGPIRGGVPCLEPRPRKQGQPSYRHRLFPALGAHRGSVVRARPPPADTQTHTTDAFHDSPGRRSVLTAQPAPGSRKALLHAAPPRFAMDWFLGP
jgi:hypothetical protein